jgi:hypothetical protein
MKGLFITKCMETRLATLMARRTRTIWRCVCHTKDTDSFKVCVSHEGPGQFQGVCVTRRTRTVLRCITRRTQTVSMSVCHTKDMDNFKVCVSHEGHEQLEGVCTTRRTRISLGLHDYTKCINLWKAYIIAQLKGPMFTLNTRTICQPVWWTKYSENEFRSSSCRQFYVSIFHVAVIFLLLHFPGITLRNKINLCENTINIKVDSLLLPAVKIVSTLVTTLYV